MKQSVVKSVRMPPELWAFVEERAKKRGIKPNAWFVRMVGLAREGRLAETAPKKKPD